MKRIRSTDLLSLQKGSGGLGMAVQDVFTNEVFCAWLKEGPSGLLVHVEDYSFCIADGYCKVSFFYVTEVFHYYSRVYSVLTVFSEFAFQR